MRGDDGVGPYVVEALLALGHDGLVHAGDGARLIDLFGLHADLILIDATRSGAAPGTLAEYDAIANPLPADFFHYSTHRFGLAEAVETARALDMLPARLRVFGIEGENFEAGTDLSPVVHAAADRLVSRLAGA